nr:hypothetical protein 1 [bacterium]
MSRHEGDNKKDRGSNKENEIKNPDDKKEPVIKNKAENNNESEFRGDHLRKGWKRYRYSGPTAGVTINQNNERIEVLFFNRRHFILPEKNKYIKNMIIKGYLKED